MSARQLIVQWLLLTLAVSHAVASEGVGPRRNLWVELRWVDSIQESAASAAARGQAYEVGTTGSASARAPMTTGTRSHGGGELVQQLLVLNGRSGSVTLTEQVPLEWLDYSVELGTATLHAGPQGAGNAISATGASISAVPRVTLMERTRSVTVYPNWPGRGQPVRVEVNAVAPIDGTQSPGQARILSTVQVMLGDWLAIARTGPGARALEPGVLSSRAAQQARPRELQLRVTLAP